MRYRVPLKRGWKGGRIPKGDAYISFLREFLRRHVKRDVKIDASVNEKIWKEKPRYIDIEIEERDGTLWAKLSGEERDDTKKPEN